ncbi:putative redox protein [Crenobacter luteus]|uniref:OsmC family protein n=1 Tax=Crenobacter luteus TaxID=1452487 RepID=UPI0010514F34|nr:OsmC family protein [Crenobacter luteus]TCP14581.1 putative redox protein [Crenobacter luteus]
MIVATPEPGGWRTRLDNGRDTARADTGAGGEGFSPHELLEAALASCMSMTVRMVAERRGIALADVTVKVWLDRCHPGAPVYDYEVALSGALSTIERRVLLAAAARCPVRRTLDATATFREHDAGPG